VLGGWVGVVECCLEARGWGLITVKGDSQVQNVLGVGRKGNGVGARVVRTQGKGLMAAGGGFGWWHISLTAVFRVRFNSIHTQGWR
jgi:hypothetical protein